MALVAETSHTPRGAVAPGPMTLAYSFALLSTLLGTVLGLSGGQGRVSGPLRSFAFVAAIAVVFGQLLPEALSEAGPIVILVFGAGVLVPRLLFHHHHGPGHGHGRTHGPDQFDDDGAHIRAGLLLGLFAMMLHQVGDGVALGAFASGAHAEHTNTEDVLRSKWRRRIDQALDLVLFSPPFSL